jgi:hypothetical protein
MATMVLLFMIDHNFFAENACAFWVSALIGAMFYQFLLSHHLLLMAV